MKPITGFMNIVIRGVPPEMICGSVPAGFDHDERGAVRTARRRPAGIARGSPLDPARSQCLRRADHSARSRAVIPTWWQRLAPASARARASTNCARSISGTLILTTKRLAFLGSLRTNSSSLDDLIGVNDVGNGIQVHRERKQKAETYVLTSPLTVDGLEITGSMIQLAIEMAKLAEEVDALEAAPASPGSNGKSRRTLNTATTRYKAVRCTHEATSAAVGTSRSTSSCKRSMH